VPPAAGAWGGSGSTYFGASDAGDYFYQVVACNSKGKAVPVDSASVTVASGDAVTFTIADGGTTTEYYEIYRTEADAAVATSRLIMKVARSGATQVVTDLNRFLPNTSRGYMLTQSADVLCWKQLAPFSKIPLATIDSSIRWMQVLYGALQIMAPQKNGMFINVGKLSTGAYGS